MLAGTSCSIVEAKMLNIEEYADAPHTMMISLLVRRSMLHEHTLFAREKLEVVMTC